MFKSKNFKFQPKRLNINNKIFKSNINLVSIKNLIKNKITHHLYQINNKKINFN